jgi:hypothetical protein
MSLLRQRRQHQSCLNDQEAEDKFVFLHLGRDASLHRSRALSIRGNV